jgi:AraC-like DNA-binding protein
MTDTLSFDEIRPFVRYVQQLTISENLNFNNMTAYDNRLFYITDGSGIIRVEESVYPVKSGDLMLWRAGVPYGLECEKGQSYTMLGCNFDFTQKNSFKTAPVPPNKVDLFNENYILDACRINMDMFNHTVYLENMQNIEHTLRSMKKEYDRQRILAGSRLSSMFLLILTDIAEAVLLHNSKISRSDSRVEEILQYIKEHYDEELGNQKLGRIFNYHPNYINRLMVAHTGHSLHKYILRYRINCAIELLQTTDMPVSDIGEKVGFRDYNHFLKYFKRATGYTTRRFRP